jgi:hypothetical protein
LHAIDSLIIENTEFEDFKQLCEFNDKTEYSLLYRGSRDGYKAKDFHAKCDSISPTLTIIKTDTECIIGGYTTAKWTSTSSVIFDSNAFIFSFKNCSEVPFKAKVDNAHNAIRSNPNFGPIFGGVGVCYYENILIDDESNISSQSYTCFPTKCYYHNDEATNFNVIEIEVFKVVN